MAKKWLDSIEKQKRSNVCDRQTDGHTHRQTALTTKIIAKVLEHCILDRYGSFLKRVITSLGSRRN